MAESALRVFISHTADDKPLADALQTALKSLFPGRIEVHYIATGGRVGRVAQRSAGDRLPGLSSYVWLR